MHILINITLKLARNVVMCCFLMVQRLAEVPSNQLTQGHFLATTGCLCMSLWIKASKKYWTLTFTFTFANFIRQRFQCVSCKKILFEPFAFHTSGVLLVYDSSVNNGNLAWDWNSEGNEIGCFSCSISRISRLLIVVMQWEGSCLVNNFKYLLSNKQCWSYMWEAYCWPS